MTVQQLIDSLQNLPKDFMVIISGYEGGVSEMTHIGQVKIKLNVNDEWYYGKHEIDLDGDVDAIYIS